MLYKVVLTFESVEKILKYNPSNESYCAVLSCDAVYYAIGPVDKIINCDLSSESC